MFLSLKNLQDQLKKMRDFDDKVVYALNNSLPTKSIQARTDSTPETNCKGLYDSLKLSFGRRSELIKGCIVLTADEVILLKEKWESSNGTDTLIGQKFKSEQRKVILIGIPKNFA